MSRKVIVTVPFTAEQQAALAEDAGRYGDRILFTRGGSASREEILDADAVIGNVSPDILSSCGHLSWVQLNSAGAEAYVKEGALPEGTVLTCATGSYGTAISEYMVCMLLVMMKKVPLYLENQKKGVWKDEGPVTTPAGKRILIVGTGDIGLSFARRIRAFGLPDRPVRLVGIRRRADACPEPLDEIYPTEKLAEQAALADVIAVALPGTASTYHLFDREMLCRCRKGCWLMNVGRGSVVETEALLDPSVSGRFSGIYLDVCEKEPLPENDPLFSVPNLYVTPHITGSWHLDVTLENLARLARHNYQAWHGEGSFASVVNRATGYAD
ncbi:MAG: D-2-hydroxyacid dehydrogenase [Lachnospiraceae bacterium]|jgi:phosphoglycerate dehydrogenase-like enzyme